MGPIPSVMNVNKPSPEKVLGRTNLLLCPKTFVVAAAVVHSLSSYKLPGSLLQCFLNFRGLR